MAPVKRPAGDDKKSWNFSAFNLFVLCGPGPSGVGFSLRDVGPHRVTGAGCDMILASRAGHLMELMFLQGVADEKSVVDFVKKASAH